VGPIKWDLALCLLFSWVVVVLCLIKGIKTSGKVNTVTLIYITVLSERIGKPGTPSFPCLHTFPPYTFRSDLFRLFNPNPANVQNMMSS